MLLFTLTMILRRDYTKNFIIHWYLVVSYLLEQLKPFLIIEN